MLSQPIAELRNVTKRYGQVTAATGLTLAIAPGEFLSFLGPSGCGKTTALRMLAGFEQASEGEVLIDGQNANGLPAWKRPVNMVFQQYALFPHLSVAENVAYGLNQRRPKPSKAGVAASVEDALALVRLQGFGPRRIWEMSGGQQQRVALARAIVNRPKILLLDEPMAALDKKLRHDMQIELKALQRELGITFILVTHDQEEALSMSDRIVIMDHGRIAQVGTPEELYDAPASRYVADFVGRSNFIPARVTSAETGAILAEAAGGLQFVARGRAVEPGREVTLLLRPEEVKLAREGSGHAMEITHRIFLGEHTEYHLRSGAIGRLVAVMPRSADAADLSPGSRVQVSWRQGAAFILTD
ncbi:ABC transporter ATP-binding protein [Pseudogemmobacter faecipullorum]|uniref:Spermidine/putrescine import ATP-binding protein PotA n=1 Tax=Pseudogemmobacter faecipullorum TaxID=2755041 RepID=A0ABS8CNH9_9RHOB|nr:ABC transporter ATP-binding protein [Pseudogemmobacter faecipullorum]MCB5410933.1 ABC transporter ATP-binding protein [Pseudogemmobacter faecipullorum]